MTMTATRTDVHRPSVLDPADYQAVGSFDLHDTEGYSYIEPEYADHDFAETRHGSWRDDSYGRCQHCGHHLRHGEVFVHIPTGELLAVGLQCATKLDLPDRDAVKDREIGRRRVLARLRGRFVYGDPRARQACEAATAAAVQAAENQRVPEYAEKPSLHPAEAEQLRTRLHEVEEELSSMVSGHPSAAARLADATRLRDQLYDRIDPLEVVQVNGFLADLGRKFERDAYLSPKQIEAAWWSAERDRQYAIRKDLQEQQREIENADREPVPVSEDRIQVTGEVVKTDWQENDYGDRKVMTVKDDRGFLVWGSVPDSIYHVEREQRVSFMARVEPSKDQEATDWQVERKADPYFGFFKRPTKAEIIK
jgi:hypothetical protein